MRRSGGKGIAGLSGLPPPAIPRGREAGGLGFRPSVHSAGPRPPRNLLRATPASWSPNMSPRYANPLLNGSGEGLIAFALRSAPHLTGTGGRPHGVRRRPGGRHRGTHHSSEPRNNAARRQQPADRYGDDNRLRPDSSSEERNRQAGSSLRHRKHMTDSHNRNHTRN